MKHILTTLAVVALFGCSCQAQESVSNIIHLVALNVVSNSAPDPAVDTALEEMLAEDKIPSSLIVAKMEWLLNRPDKAISILEDLIQRHGEESDHGYLGHNSVALTGNLWIGTIARENGDAKRAMKAYDDILDYVDKNPKYEGMKRICYLYIAEIEAVMLNQNGAAIETLQKNKIAPVLSDPGGGGGKRAKIYNMYLPGEDMNWNANNEWVDYQIAILHGKQDEARKALEGSNLINQKMLGSMVGPSGVNLDAWVTSSNKKDIRILLIHGLQTAIKSNSSIDRCFALLALGSELQTDQPAEAEGYYKELLESDSFYAPEGGIYLADLQRKQGKADDAKKTYERIKERFPAYTKYVDELSKSPVRNWQFNL